MNTCAAVGAIRMGWVALKAAEQVRILETVQAGIGLSITVVPSVIELVVKEAKRLLGKPDGSAVEHARERT